MEYVSEVADIVTGDVVVTSGIDGIFPKGFVIGRIEAVEKSGGAYKKITVRPAVDFSSLEEVLVVLTPRSPKDAAAERNPTPQRSQTPERTQ
jgi:rod shape-determining protein MreC